jgi:hypothetical protein
MLLLLHALCHCCCQQGCDFINYEEVMAERSVDMFVNYRGWKVAVEADGPFHYAKNRSGRQQAASLSMQTCISVMCQ